MTLILLLTICAAILVPHLVELRRTPATIAASLWAVALGLRAALGLTLVLCVVLLVPTTAQFAALTNWCWHAVLPLLSTHLGLEGHRLGGVLTALPGALLALSATSILVGLVRAGRRARSMVARSGLGPGPHGAVIVGGTEVVLAVAGFKRPQLVVSAGALLELDDAELAAGLAHEQGHIARNHRWVLVYGEVCRGLGRFLPGTSAAKDQLAFHLERDADAWATREHDRVALAGAICKAAMSRATPAPGYALLAGASEVTGRLDELLDGAAPRLGLPPAILAGCALAGAVLLVVLLLTVAISLAGPTPSGVALAHCFI